MARLVRWIAKGAVVMAAVRMARSKNRVVRNVGRVGGIMAAPRATRLFGRRPH